MATPRYPEARIEARVRNNRLWHAIRDVYPNVASFCRAHKFNEQQIGNLLNLKDSPINRKSGGWTPTAERLAEATGIGADELFPLKLYGLETVEVVREFDLAALPEPERTLMLASGWEGDVAEVTEAVADVLDEALSERERSMVKLYFGFEGEELSMEQIGKRFDISRTRVGEIIRNAMAKLHRSPYYFRLMPPFRNRRVDPIAGRRDRG